MHPCPRVDCCFGASVRGASIDPVDFFKSRIRPILVNQCYACHTDLKMGGLQLDSRDHVLQGGNSGPAVCPEIRIRAC